MPYAVNYGSDDLDKYPVKRTYTKYKKKYFLVTIFMLLLLVLTIRFKESVVSWLVPGDDEVTLQHAEELFSDLREGVPIGEALSTFCEVIIADEE